MRGIILIFIALALTGCGRNAWHHTTYGKVSRNDPRFLDDYAECREEANMAAPGVPGPVRRYPAKARLTRCMNEKGWRTGRQVSRPDIVWIHPERSETQLIADRKGCEDKASGNDRQKKTAVNLCLESLGWERQHAKK